MSIRNDLRNAIARLKRAEAAFERAKASGKAPDKIIERINTARQDIAAIRSQTETAKTIEAKAETETPDDYVASGPPDSVKEQASDTPMQAGGGSNSDKFQSDLRAEVGRWADDAGRRSGSIVLEVATARWMIEGSSTCGVFNLKFPGLKEAFTEAGGPAGTWRAAAAFGARLVEAPDATSEAAASRNKFIEAANRYLDANPIELNQFGEAVTEVSNILRKSFTGGWRKFDLALSGRGQGEAEAETKAEEAEAEAETKAEEAEAEEAKKMSASEVAAIFVTESDQAAITGWVANLSGEACLKLITALAERRNELVNVAS